MTKIKHVRTADCVLAGYRVHKAAADAIGSLLLGLLRRRRRAALAVGRPLRRPRPGRRDRRVPDGPPPRAVRRAAAARRRLRRAPVELGGRASPRGPGGRQPLEPRQGPLASCRCAPSGSCEVRYDYLEGARFRHPPQFVRWRPDRDPETCGYAQLDQPSAVRPRRGASRRAERRLHVLDGPGRRCAGGPRRRPQPRRRRPGHSGPTRCRAQHAVDARTARLVGSGVLARPARWASGSGPRPPRPPAPRLRPRIGRERTTLRAPRRSRPRAAGRRSRPSATSTAVRPPVHRRDAERGPARRVLGVELGISPAKNTRSLVELAEQQRLVRRHRARRQHADRRSRTSQPWQYGQWTTWPPHSSRTPGRRAARRPARW